MNNLIKEALEIAISNWEYDGEYDKVSEAVTLIKEAEGNEQRILSSKGRPMSEVSSRGYDRGRQQDSRR